MCQHLIYPRILFTFLHNLNLCTDCLSINCVAFINIPIWNTNLVKLFFWAMSMDKSIYSQEYKHLVARLQEARQQANLTQKQVAEYLAVGQSFISKIESGQYRVDLIQLLRFAKLYKKDLTFFIK